MYLYMMLFNDGTVIPSLLNYLYVSRINHDNAKWSTHLWSEKKRVPLVRRLCKVEPRGGGRIPGGSNRQALPERRITEARLLPAGELGGRSNSLQLYSRREAARARLAELERERRGRRRACRCKEQTRSSQHTATRWILILYIKQKKRRRSVTRSREFSWMLPRPCTLQCSSVRWSWARDWSELKTCGSEGDRKTGRSCATYVSSCGWHRHARTSQRWQRFSDRWRNWKHGSKRLVLRIVRVGH